MKLTENLDVGFVEFQQWSDFGIWGSRSQRYLLKFLSESTKNQWELQKQKDGPIWSS